MYAVQQLADGDHADGGVFGDHFATEQSTFDCDQHARVDQDSHGSPVGGGPTLRRISSRSLRNSSSEGGNDAKISRIRSGGSSLSGRGGLITAIVAPLRVTSISSPALTRFRTSENERDTSVAVIFVTSKILSDKSDIYSSATTADLP